MEDKEYYTTEEIIEKFESLRPHVKNLKMIAENAKKEVFDDIDKELNHTLKAFSKLMQEYKIHSGVQTKLLLPFMRFHILIKRHLQLSK